MTILSAEIVDITTLDVDAIVNAANTDLKPGGGVCGAIHRAAGPELAAACAELRGCPTGEARITPGFKLKAKYVIHAVGPVWRGGAAGEAERLASCYRRSLEIAAGLGLATVAFPCISTGLYGYPLEPAARVAVATVRDTAARLDGLREVLFCCFSAADLRVYEAVLAEPDG